MESAVDENNVSSNSIVDRVETDATDTVVEDDSTNHSTAEVQSEAKADVTNDDNESSEAHHIPNTKPERFTSEIFKIEIGNLPRFFGFGECKKLLSKKLQLKPHKMTCPARSKKAYVTFKNEADKSEALEKLNGFKYKGNLLAAKSAKPKADMMATKRQACEDASGSPPSKQKKIDMSLTKEEILKNSVIPWWRKTYEEQLAEKQSMVCKSLVEIRKKIGTFQNLDKQIFRWIMELKKESGQCCPSKPILASPITSGYRNKCSFTAGRNLDNEVDVGFRLGKYRDQTCAVEPPTCLVHVSDVMKRVVQSFTNFVRNSKLTVYDREIYKGNWRQLLLRTSRNNSLMAVVAICKQNLSDEEIKQEQESLCNHFKSEDIKLDTLMFRIITDVTVSNIVATSAAAYTGEGVIYENLFDVKFRISPDAFFQVNTPAAEVLYKCVKNMALKKVVNKTEFCEDEANDEVVLLDVCCGTGAIGLCLAKHVKKVIGVDICKEAIEDAKINARLNDITNVEFRCNKAEEELPNLIRQLPSFASSVVAVVDPPRCGLHHTVIKAIRECELIQKLVFVSCSIDQAKPNFYDLMRPTSKRMHGRAFMPIVAQTIDLFPHTPHCEVVVLLERTS